MKITVRWDPHTHQRSKKCRVCKKKRGRKMSTRQEVLRTVEILQKATQQPGALNDPRFDESPFFGRNQKWHNVDFPGSVYSERIAVYVVRDAVLANAAFGALPASSQLLGADCPE